MNNTSQLAGFTKSDDLRYFLSEICGAGYLHLPLLAPTNELMGGYKKRGESWDYYERHFLALMQERQVEKHLAASLFDLPSVLLCSEATADQCHRRLVAEYLQRKWGSITIHHL